MNTYPSRKKSSIKRPVIVSATVLFVLVALFAILELTNVTHFFHKATIKRPVVTAGQTTKGETQPSATTNTQSSTPTTSQSSNTTGAAPGDAKEAPASSTTLIQPTGNFVSAHKNVPLDATLSSVCNTTAGAKCQIIFTSGNVVKSLPAQTTDRGGATYWNSWTPASIGLTSGSWQVKAVATLNGQTQTNIDAMSLDIQ